MMHCVYLVDCGCGLWKTLHLCCAIHERLLAIRCSYNLYKFLFYYHVYQAEQIEWENCLGAFL
jgi:hypothetical protein